MSLSAARTFLLGAYHDLPNVLFIGTLLFGSMSGNLPLVWMSMGLLFTAGITGIVKGILMFLTTRSNPLFWRDYSNTCEVATRMAYRSFNGPSSSAGSKALIVPSLWIATTVFFATFSTYNGVRLALRKPTEGASEEMVDVRRAFSYTVIATGILFALLVLARFATGCESWLGALLGVVVGGGSGVAFWHILDACGTGAMPDIHQVIGSMAPPGSGTEIPVVCAPPEDIPA